MKIIGEGTEPAGPASVEGVREAINAIMELDLNVCTIDQIKAVVRELVRGVVFVAPVIQPGTTLFRARVFDSATPPEFLSDIGAPSPTKISHCQRCNRAGQAMFYATSGKGAALTECHVAPGQYVALSKWRTTLPVKLNQVGYTKTTFWRLGANRECPVWSSRNETEANKVAKEFLASAFSVDVPEWREEWYKLTAAITEILIDNPEIGGLIYPTIPMSARADNVALRPRFVSAGVAFVSVHYMVVRERSGLKTNVDIFDFAKDVTDSGCLDWKGRREQWVLRKQGERLSFTVEHGERVARDSAGNIVEPE